MHISAPCSCFSHLEVYYTVKCLVLGNPVQNTMRGVIIIAYLEANYTEKYKIVNLI